MVLFSFEFIKSQSLNVLVESLEQYSFDRDEFLHVDLIMIYGMNDVDYC